MHKQFDIIYKQIQQLGYIKKSIVGKLEHLKQIYGDMVKSNNNKKIFLLCLESFHFQYKAFNVELGNLDRLYLLFSNRAYNDYCSTYALLHKHYVEYGLLVPTETLHRPYKDLEPFAEYTLDEICLAHSNAVQLLDGLKQKYKENVESITSYKEKMMLGIRISSFIYTLEYDNNVLHDQIRLYDSYFQFYYDVQTKYFSGLLAKLKAFMGQIDGEIKIPDNSLIEENDVVSQVSDDAYIMQNIGIMEPEVSLAEAPSRETEFPLAEAPSWETEFPLENNEISLTIAEVGSREQAVELTKVVQMIQKKVDIETLSTDSGSEVIEQAIKVIDSTVSEKPIRKRRGA